MVIDGRQPEQVRCNELEEKQDDHHSWASPNGISASAEPSSFPERRRANVFFTFLQNSDKISGDHSNARQAMDEKWDKVASLDLKSVRQKFAFKKGWWWLFRNNAQRVENEYRQFLYLIAVNPGQTVVPWSRELDDFWHEHILDTAKYARDCETIMGGFIHHNPHVPEETFTHTKALHATREMYKAAFGRTVRKGRKRTKDDVGCVTMMPVVFCEGGGATGHHHTGGHHHGDGGGHHGGGHGGGHGCSGHGGGHGCGGHGCGGHGGH
jgi:hypothetical protein